MFSLGGTFTLRAARLSLAHRILLLPPSRRRTSTPSPPPQEERAGERRPTLLNTPLPGPSPRSFLAGRGRRFLAVKSRCARCSPARGRRRLPFVAVSNSRHFLRSRHGSHSRGRTPLKEYKRLAWRAICQLRRCEEEVGTGCAKEQIRQGRTGK
jgi:hypothetical protein